MVAVTGELAAEMAAMVNDTQGVEDDWQSKPACRRYFWSGIGWISLALGFLGILLPLLPTTPFVLLSLFAFSKSYPSMRRWILHHPLLGPPVLRWKERRCIERKTRRWAFVSLAASFSISFWFSWETPWLCVLLAVILATLTTLLLRLPVDPTEKPPLAPGQLEKGAWR